MSLSPKAILLPKLIPSDAVGIGYLLHKPLYPSMNSRAVSVPDEQCTLPYVEPDYKTTVSTKADGSLVASVTQLFGLTFGKKRSTDIQIEAKQMTYRTLKNHDATFHSICEDKDTREWINKMHRYGKKIYFVVGLQTLQQAHFRREMIGNIGGNAVTLLPAMPVASFPIDIQLKASSSVQERATAESGVNGVFGIEVRKIKSRIKNVDEPVLDDECSWSFTPERVKGTGQLKVMKICVTLDNFVDEEELATEGDSDSEDED